MKHITNIYLDIETTGLSPFGNGITVIGVYRCNGKENKFIQLVGDTINRENLLKALADTDIIYTYNGKRFDLRFIHASLGINLEEMFNHQDLMYDCWRNNLYGGFKAVERQLRIPRKLQGIGGYDAVLLWLRYINNGDHNALNLLLEYNKEDVLNLKVLRDKLVALESCIDEEGL